MPKTETETKTGPTGDGAATGRDASALTVMLVDLDPESRRACATALAAEHRVVEVHGRSAAAERIERDPPDLIVLDADAYAPATCRAWARLLDASRGRRDIVLIVLARPETSARVLADLNCPIDACLTKPVTGATLMHHVRRTAKRVTDGATLGGLRELRGEQTRMWNVLLDYSRALGRTVDLDTVLDKVVAAAAELTCSRRVSLMLPDATEEFLRIEKSIGIDEETRAEVRLPVGEAIAGRAFVSGRQFTGEAGTRSGAPESVYDGGSFVSVPIRAAKTSVTQRSVGVLNITHRYGDRRFQEWELEFVDLLASIAASVIDDTLWRQARESLLKFESDLQVARRIQQKTFPFRLPRIDGFDLDAWSEPAEETGGDTYDIIGYRREADGGLVRLVADEPERVVLLLADATGHGIGPALSVTQVRSMLRMAVRMEPDLARIAVHMNDQLCADLPRGRFITAWIGELETTNHTLTCLSAGQGPILRYDATRDEIIQIGADTLPLGVLEDLDVPIAAPIALEPGDIVAVISDGVFEAEDREGRLFGVERVTALIRDHRAEPAERIMLELREAVAAFAGGAGASDDRTALILKRTNG